MLASARREYDEQQQIAALAVVQAQRLANRNPAVIAQSVRQYQAAAIATSMQALPGILAEQGIAQSTSAVVIPAALLTATSALVGILSTIQSNTALVRFVRTLVGDASKTARALDGFTRPAVTGYIRALRPPSCSNCVILAGRVYTHSQGFDRHPNDDCEMVSTDHEVGPGLVTDPMEAFRKGWITDLSGEDTEAVKNGANLAQRVNFHRKRGSYSVGTSVLDRTSPQDILAGIEDRLAAAIALRQAGFIT